MSDFRGSILINGVFSNAIGHVVECFVAAAAFRNANPGARIGAMVNSATPPELASLIPHLKLEVIRVETRDFTPPAAERPLFGSMDRKWDCLLTLRDGSEIDWDDGLRGFHREFMGWVEAGQRWTLGGIPDPGFPLCRPQPLRFQLPDGVVAGMAGYFGPERRPKIIILPGAARFQKAPTLAFWRELIAALHAKYADAAFVLIGSDRQDFSHTQATTAGQMDEFAAGCRETRSAFWRTTLEQLAIAAQGDLLISPHSGFGFAVQCMGTPWLVLSGGANPEVLFNGAPIASVFPECDRYPCGGYTERNQMRTECRDLIAEGKRPVLCLDDAHLIPAIPMILAKADEILSGRNYRSFVTGHRLELLRRGYRGSIIDTAPR